MRRASRRLAGVSLCLLLTLVSSCSSPEGNSEAIAASKPDTSGSLESVVGRGEASFLGDGFVVWESNRSRSWRLWSRELGPSAPRQLTRDEEEREHCCAHISPDGRWIAYLSFPDAMAGYASGGSEGVLRLIRPDGSEDRIVAESARSSWESRAAVWRSDHELIYIRGDRATVLHDLDNDRVEVLAQGDESKTWLVDSRLRHAVSGAADFSIYRHSSRAIAERRTYGGCQPYFSHDGRWGFWAAGTGGPLNRIELETGAVSTILSKSDPRVPDGLGYAYFPMFSRDGRLFAFAASDYDHNHFLADYEIFVAPSDPDSLELLGDAVRMTRHPATDRFPDVYLEPLPLGRWRGEAPFTVELEAPGESAATRWDFGDGESSTGARVRHTYQRPGTYRVSASPSGADATTHYGQVVVQPAAAPVATAVRLREEGRSVEVLFDEAIRAEEPSLRFESGIEVAAWSVGTSETGAPSGAERLRERYLRIEVKGRIDGFDRLFLDGISDRAQVPNWLEPVALDIEPPLWPSDRTGLAFVWETGEAANLVTDANLGTDRASSLTPAGRAFLDRNFAMTLRGGHFAAAKSDAASILEACRKSHEFSLEAVIQPQENATGGLRKIISFSGGTPQSRNFVLAQKGNRLIFNPRAGNPYPDATPEVEIGPIPADRQTHVVIAYQVGRLVAYFDGEKVLETEAVQGGFFHWKPRPLVFGNGPGGGDSWSGTLEGVAIYSRFLAPEEVRENHVRYRRKLAERPTVPRLVIEATLLAESRAPGLAEITPYREALLVAEYRVEHTIEGTAPGERLRVARWAILDGAYVDGKGAPAVGDRIRLTLEPFVENPQLASLYLADTLEAATGPLYYAVP